MAVSSSSAQAYPSRTNLVLVFEFLEIVILDLKIQFQIVHFCLQTYTQILLSITMPLDPDQSRPETIYMHLDNFIYQISDVWEIYIIKFGGHATLILSA